LALGVGAQGPVTWSKSA